MSEQSKNSGAVGGVWTPWAEVLCVLCHGRWRNLTDEEHAKLCVPIEAAPEGQAITTCDRCQRKTYLSEKVAREHEVMLALRRELGSLVREVCMHQTGGMCSAASVTLHDGHSVLITEAEQDNEVYMAGFYDQDVDGDEGLRVTETGDTSERWCGFLTREQLAPALKALVDKKVKSC